tara:strand:+ start:871 stop:1545 length:675 start_codon:yes stop_codon:yes gene_type:complete
LKSSCFYISQNSFIPKFAKVILFTGFLFCSQQSKAEQTSWFVSGQIGSVSTDISTKSLTSSLNDQGALIDSVSVKDSDTGYQAAIGYKFNAIYSLQVGYVGFGERHFSFTGEVTDLDSFHSTMKQVYPESATGPQISLLASWPISKEISLTGKVGYLDWHQDYQYQTDSSQLYKAKRSGNSVTFGIEASFALFKNTQIFLSYDHAALDATDASMLSIGARYYFD